MGTFVYNDEIESGATVYLKCKWFTDTAKTLPKQLAGTTIFAKVYNLKTGAEVSDTMEIIRGNSADDAAGTAYARITATVTDELEKATAFNYRYKIICTEPDEVTKTVVQKGNLLVLA